MDDLLYFGRLRGVKLTTRLKCLISINELEFAIGEFVKVVEFDLHVIDEELLGIQQQSVFSLRLGKVDAPS